MVSAYVARPFGLGIYLSSCQLKAVNKLRSKEEYVSKEFAMKIHGTTKKQPLVGTHQLVRYFYVGINHDGYWNHETMSLQNEDAYDVFRVVYPDHHIILLSDQSSGHRKRADDALHAPSMSKNWGGSQPIMHPTIVKELGPYPPTLALNQQQHMTFQKQDTGPFYLPDAKTMKNDQDTGKTQKVKRTKVELLKLLKRKNNIDISHFLTIK